jgi:biofilm PGA synthesis lipoprotein PgaB
MSAIRHCLYSIVGTLLALPACTTTVVRAKALGKIAGVLASLLLWLPSLYAQPTNETAAITGTECQELLRVMHVDLDYVYDSDATQQQRNAELLVERAKQMQVNTVFLQAFADPAGDGLVRSLYFPNRWLPMRANLFGPLSERLRTEANVHVYAWMPVLSFDLAPDLARITSANPQALDAQPETAQGRYARLSPFDPQARQQIAGIYEDLATHAVFDGLLFHDDAVMTDYEDAGEHALAAYSASGLPASIALIRSDPALVQRWTRLKSHTLNQFTIELRDVVQAVRGKPLKTARNLFALPILQPYSETWFAQNLDDFLMLYDWTAPMAMPLMEGISEAHATQWLQELVDTVATRPDALCRTIFELQTRDWSKPDQPAIDDTTLALWIQTLQLRGAKSFGYYPDDFHRNAPDAQQLAPIMSSRDPL